MTIPPDQSRGRRTVAIAIAAFAVCSAAAAIRSPGFLEADGANHFMYARHAFQQPYYFVDVWGRPLCTALFALPAQVGLTAVRLTSLAVAIGCALVAYAIALGQGYRYPALAAIFTLGQPLLFLHSFSEMTELPFAFLVGGAFLAYQRRKWGVMAALATIAPLGRPEGFGFLFLAAVALLAHRRGRWLALLPVGLIGWSIAGHLLVGPADQHWWLWLPQHWPWQAGSSYPSGNALRYVALLPVLMGPFALPAVVLGVALSLQSVANHRQRVQCLIAILSLGILAAHSLFYALGILSTAGDLRYLLVVSPLWGLLAACGWEWAFTKLHWAGATRWAALAAVSAGMVNYVWRIVPIPESATFVQARRLADWYRQPAVHARYPRLMCNHPGVYFYLDISPSDYRNVSAWSRLNAANPQEGLVMIWDREYCLANASQDLIVTLPQIISYGWVNDRQAELLASINYPPLGAGPGANGPHQEQWHIFRSPRDATGQPTPAATQKRDGMDWREMLPYAVSR